MAFPHFLSRLLSDPPPAYAFELSEGGVAAAEIGRQPRLSFGALERDVLAVSPLRDNVLRPEALLARLRAMVPADGSRKRRRAAVILPDYAVRVTVLDFDAFPSDTRQQASLVRFRLKRAVPFDVEAAALSFHAQPAGSQGGKKKVDVVAAVAPLEIIAHYEAPFRLAGIHPGLVTTSTLAALDLMPPTGLHLLAKRTGRVLSVAVADQGVLRLIRTIELAELDAAEIAGHLFPTLAYVEDHFGEAPAALHVCGFGPDAGQTAAWLESELRIKVEALASRWGRPGEFDAGLLGYLEAAKEA